MGVSIKEVGVSIKEVGVSIKEVGVSIKEVAAAQHYFISTKKWGMSLSEIVSHYLLPISAP